MTSTASAQACYPYSGSTSCYMLTFNLGKWIGLHSTTQPPVQDAAIEIVRRSATKV